MKVLEIAGVPESRHAWIKAQQAQARSRARGLLWHKVKARLLMSWWVTRKLPWDAERLPAKHAKWDIAPVLNITCNGDNVPWELADGVSRPKSTYWMNPDPASDEYRQAVAATYWCKGHHPRSVKARRAWYRRNGGEHEAWARGVDLHTPGVEVWHGERGRVRVTVVGTSGSYVIHAQRRLFGRVALVSRKGYEVDNVSWRSETEMGWMPMPGHRHRAPVTWGYRLRRWV